MRVEDEDYAGLVLQYYEARAIPLLERLVERDDVNSILDLGCGDGANLYALKARGLLKEKDVHAIDVNAERVRRARSIDPSFDCVVADVCDISEVIADGSMDLVLACQVIEHVDGPEAMVRELARVLRPGGHLYLTTVFKRWYGWYFYRNERGAWVVDPTHRREYRDDAELIPLLESAGFEVIENDKRLCWFPVSDFFLHRISMDNRAYERSTVLRWLRRLKVPVPGYFYWDLVLRRT